MPHKLPDIYDLAYSTDNKPYFTVHDGTFHPDDVASVALASRLFGGVKNVNIIRTRDPKKFKGLTMDVGEGDFDHHGSAYAIDEEGVPYSAFSRVYGRVKDKLLQDAKAQEYFKHNVVDPVSKLDNGIALRRGEKSVFNWVPSFNNNYVERNDPQGQNKRFMEAVGIADKILDRELQNAIADAQSTELKNSILNEAKRNDIVYVPKGIDLSKELPATNAKFTLTMLGDGTYRLQSVPKAKGNSFTKKVPFPKEWAGLRDKELQQVSGINDAIFCHSGRFLAGFKSRASAMAAARYVLRQRNKNRLYENAVNIPVE